MKELQQLVQLLLLLRGPEAPLPGQSHHCLRRHHHHSRRPLLLLLASICHWFASLWYQNGGLSFKLSTCIVKICRLTLQTLALLNLLL